MKCVYINLDRATDRRASLEASFAAADHGGWELVRLPALGPADVGEVAGSRTAPQKACFASHLAALDGAPGDGEPVLIVEDDTRFSRQTFTVLDRIIASSIAWDVVFLDLTFLYPNDMYRYAKQWNRLRRDERHVVDSLSGVGFAASSAYLVRGEARRRLREAVAPFQGDLAYDVALRTVCHRGALQMRVCFPFLTTLAAEGDVSQIQGDGWGNRDLAVNAFRRLMFVERDLDAMAGELAALERSFQDPGAAAVGLVFAGMVSDAFPDSW
jgi:GR25 family glycosyltransferase involved in LPS biosynthesis